MDYSTVLSPSTLTFPMGSVAGPTSQQCFDVELLTDNIVEATESFLLLLTSQDSLLTIDSTRGQATVNIIDINSTFYIMLLL